MHVLQGVPPPAEGRARPDGALVPKDVPSTFLLDPFCGPSRDAPLVSFRCLVVVSETEKYFGQS